MTNKFKEEYIDVQDMYEMVKELKKITKSVNDNSSEDRVKEITEFLDDPANLVTLTDYLSTQHYKRLNVKKSTDILTENHYMMGIFRYLADYMLKPLNGDKKDILTTERMKNIRKWETNDKIPVNNFPIPKQISVNKSNYVSPNKEIFKAREDDYYEIVQMKKYIASVDKLVGKGESKVERERLKNEIVNKGNLILEKYGKENFMFKTGQQYYSRIISTRNAVHADIKLLMDCLTNPIKFKKIGKSSGILDYNYSYIPLGSIKEFDCRTDKFEETSFNTILWLLRNYRDFSDTHNTNFNDMWATLFILDETIEKTELNKCEQLVLYGLKNQFTHKEVKELIFKNLEMDVSISYISKAMRIHIPNKIYAAWIEWKLDWIYLHVFKGKYQQCSDCNVIKLLISRYFGVNKSNKSGYKNKCKMCEKLT